MAQPSSLALRVPGPAASIGTGMSPAPREDRAAALNEVLSEVIDTILDVRQAHRRVPESRALHADLDQLFTDLRMWARLLADADQALEQECRTPGRDRIARLNSAGRAGSGPRCKL